LARASEVMVQVTYGLNDLPATFYYGFVNANLAEEAGPAYRDLQANAYALVSNGMAVFHLHSVVRHYQHLMEKAINSESEPYTHYWTQLNLGMTAAVRGDWALSQEHLISSSRWANDMGNARHWSEAQDFLISALLLSGSLAKGKAVCQELHARALHTQDKQSQGFALGNLACILICEGDIEQTEIILQHNDELVDRTPGHAPFTFTLGLFVQNLVRQGRLERAETYLSQFLALPSLNAPVAYILTPVYSGVAEGALTLWELAPSQAHSDAARKTVRAMRSCGRNFDCAKPFALLYDGWLAWLEGNFQRATNLGEQAINAAQRLEMPYAEGLAHYHLGRHLPSEDRRRVKHLRQAESIFDRLGAAYDLDKTRQALSKPLVNVTTS
jgi:eukaryotic-like serine/threonine-protein kinase